MHPKGISCGAPVVIFLAGLDFESAPKGSDPPDIESFCSDSEKNGCMDEG